MFMHTNVCTVRGSNPQPLAQTQHSLPLNQPGCHRHCVGIVRTSRPGDLFLNCRLTKKCVTRMIFDIRIFESFENERFATSGVNHSFPLGEWSHLRQILTS